MRIIRYFILFTLFRNFKKRMDTENYISPNKITKQYDITSGTLRRWSEAGKIRCIRPNGGKRIYNIEDIRKIFNSDSDTNNTQNTVTEEKNQKMGDFDEVFENLKNRLEKINSKESIDMIRTELNGLLDRFNSFN